MSTKMNYFSLIMLVKLIYVATVSTKECNIKCPEEDVDMLCALRLSDNTYKMFPSKCTLDAYRECHQVDIVETPMKYCIKNEIKRSRRSMYGESCPVFCPTHYRPVCGASNFRSYVYRSFTNGCYLDMLNCRGDGDFDGFTEVPLQYCQRHAMKNIFKEQVVVSNLHDFAEYDYA